MEERPTLYTVKEAAAFLRVSLSILYQAIAEGQLAHFRIGGRGKRGTIRISEEQLQSFLQEADTDLPAPISTKPQVEFKILDGKRLRDSWHQQQERRLEKEEDAQSN